MWQEDVFFFLWDSLKVARLVWNLSCSSSRHISPFFSRLLFFFFDFSTLRIKCSECAPPRRNLQVSICKRNGRRDELEVVTSTSRNTRRDIYICSPFSAVHRSRGESTAHNCSWRIDLWIFIYCANRRASNFYVENRERERRKHLLMRPDV